MKNSIPPDDQPLKDRRISSEPGEGSQDSAATPRATDPTSDGSETEDNFDPFDPEQIRAHTDYGPIGEPVLTRIDVRKPHRDWWVRVHPSEEFQISLEVLEVEDGMDRDTFHLAPDIVQALRQLEEPNLVHVYLFLAINRAGELFLWKIRAPADQGGGNKSARKWQQSAMDGVNYAKSHWIRIFAKTDAGRYQICTANIDMAEPVWPDLSMREILKLAFGDYYISSMDHPAIAKLRGQA
jgi:hypothetical protein